MGVCLLPEPANDSSSCQRLCVEKGLWVAAWEKSADFCHLLVSQSDHRIDAHRTPRGNICREKGHNK